MEYVYPAMYSSDEQEGLFLNLFFCRSVSYPIIIFSRIFIVRKWGVMEKKLKVCLLSLLLQLVELVLRVVF